MPGWQPARYSRAQLEERRLAALEWIARGTHKNQQIADHFGGSVHTVYSWKGRLKRNGSLTSGHGGQRSSLTAHGRARGAVAHPPEGGCCASRLW
ncbi:helix-turn-helix domain-containing protein, partial [Deinococcus malanensis]|uniref:helix-turn-helix domain-containing protein n=1 Tax=Deinococcus malanensis TaxID=1706855 RepID=UPI0016689621